MAELFLTKQFQVIFAKSWFSNSYVVFIQFRGTYHFLNASLICRLGENETSNTVDNSSVYKFAELTIKASGFLWHQIRCIVSVICEIGRRRESPEVWNCLATAFLTFF